MGEGPVLFLPPLSCLLPVEGLGRKQPLAAPAPYLGPLAALGVSLLVSTFSACSQGTCGGGDRGLGALVAVGPAWQLHGAGGICWVCCLLPMLSHRGKLCWSRARCSVLRLLASKSELVPKSRDSAKSLLEAGVLASSSCTPKICLFYIEMVEGNLGSCHVAAQLLGQGCVVQGLFSVRVLPSAKGLSEILLWTRIATSQWSIWMLQLCGASGR